MSTRQLIVVIGAIAIVSAGLSWWLQRFELSSLHEEIKDYLGRHDAFRKWEEGQPE